MELCHFSGGKILPSRGKKYVRVDGKVRSRLYIVLPLEHNDSILRVMWVSVRCPSTVKACWCVETGLGQ